jgi:hypothetical protein
MRNGIGHYALFVIMMVAVGNLVAQDAESPRLSMNGYLLVDERATIGQKPVVLAWQEYRLSLKNEFKIPGSARFASEVWIRSIGFPDISRLADIQSSARLSPIELSLKEASVELYNCGIDKLDLKIGRQRIAWGTADKINPTDNLDAPDLEDVWDFGRRLSSDAIKATYYIGDFSLSAVAIPFFTPALMPHGPWLNALVPPETMPESVAGLATLGTITEHIELPSLRPAECSNGGVKIGGRIGDYDVSVSYAYTRDHLPIIYKKVLTPTAADFMSLPLTLNVDAYLKYPRQQVVGLDFAGALGQVGVWAEAGLFFPEKVELSTEYKGAMPTLQQMAMLPPTIQMQLLEFGKMVGKTDLVLDEKPYAKFVVGADYTFPANIYCNMQYVHGYVHERGDSLEDYIMGSLDWKVLNEKLTLSPLGVGLEIKDFSHFSDNYAFIAQPKIVWKPVDNAELSLGARIITGANTTQFGRLKDYDEVFGQVRYMF